MEKESAKERKRKKIKRKKICEKRYMTGKEIQSR